MPVKSAITFLHRWAGMTLGLLCILMAVSGVVLSMRPQLEEAVYPQYRAHASCTEPASVDAMIASAQQAYPGQVSYIRLSAGSGESARVRFKDQQTVFVDPCTAGVLGTQHRYGGLFGVMEQVHKLAYGSLSVEVFGTSLDKLLPGAAALTLVFMVIGGLYLWWPRRRSAWGGAVRLNPQLTGRARWRNLHTTIGIYTGLIMLFSALTGLPIAFDWPKAVLGAIAGSAPVQPAVKSKPPTPDAQPMDLDTVWQRIRADDPAVEEALINLPTKAGSPITGFTIDRDAPHAEARNLFWYDAYTGEKLRAQPFSQMGGGMQLYYWGLSLHTARTGGLPMGLLLMIGALGVPVLAYTGVVSWLRRHQTRAAVAPGPIAVKIAAIRREAEGISSFELVPVGRKPLPPFSPGAHIDVVIAEGLTRQYSLCNGPNETDRYIIAVKREAKSRGGSQALHERMRQGDRLLISAPRSNFPLVPAAKRHMLIAAGIGITPILCMARHLQADGAEWSMHYISRSLEETPFLRDLQQPGFAGHVTFHTGLDRAQRLERLKEAARQHQEGTHLYVCGPRDFMKTVLETAKENGWPEKELHAEHFGADPLAFAGPQHSFEVELVKSGRTVTVPANLSIAKALDAHGIDVPVSCEQGLCGSCVTEVIEGVPDHRDSFLTPAERESGRKIALCVSRARSDRLVLAA